MTGGPPESGDAASGGFIFMGGKSPVCPDVTQGAGLVAQVTLRGGQADLFVTKNVRIDYASEIDHEVCQL